MRGLRDEVYKVIFTKRGLPGEVYMNGLYQVHTT